MSVRTFLFVCAKTQQSNFAYHYHHHQQRQQQRFLVSSGKITTTFFTKHRCCFYSATPQNASKSTSSASASASTTSTSTNSALPDSIKRVGTSVAFPNEYPGQNYVFNWCLNGDGVTPLRRSAFRITKPLDLKIAGLQPLATTTTTPLKVQPINADTVPEAGSDKLSFEQFDEVSQRTRDLLSLSDHLYCPEGHVPGTRTGVRFITNSAVLAPTMVAYLERAPKKNPPISLPITCYVLEGTEEGFTGYAIEEIETPIVTVSTEEIIWTQGNASEEEEPMEAKSVASVVVVGKKPDFNVIVAGIELCQKALAVDEEERKAKKEAESKA